MDSVTWEVIDTTPFLKGLRKVNKTGLGNPLPLRSRKLTAKRRWNRKLRRIETY